MTRTQAFFFTLGILMILYGVAGKSWLTGSEGGPDGTGRAEDPAGPGSSSEPGFVALPTPRRTPGTSPRKPTERPTSNGSPSRPSTVPADTTIALQLILKDADTGQPCAGALAELWRSPKGTGPAYRPARRLSSPGGSPADRDGRVTLSAPLGVGVEVLARTQDGGPRKRVVIGVLESAPSEPTEIRLQRAPSPLRVNVTDSAQRPIPGVSIRIVSEGARPRAEYSASGVLGSRTGGNGESTLSGKARAAKWLLLDAPGYSPMAISLAALAPTENIEASLPGDTALELDIVDDAGNALVKAVVEVEFSLAGFLAARTAATDERGHVTIGHLPADTPLRPVVTPKGGLPQTVEVLESPPGEVLRATLHVIQ